VTRAGETHFVSECSICGDTQVRERYAARDRLGNSNDDFVIAQCEGCSVLRTLPELNDEQLAAYYPQDYWGSDEPSAEWIKSSQAEKTNFLRECSLTGGRILDIGCGSGLFLRALDGSHWDCHGVEPGPAAAEAARRALGRDRVHAGSLLDAAYKTATFDLVTLWSALEHTNDPGGQLQEARRILKPEGTLIVQVPNAGSYQCALFGGHWFALDAPRHRYHFTEATLRRVLNATGFEPVHITFRSRSHNGHALRQSLKSILWKIRPAPVGRCLFLLSIPLIRPCDAIMSATPRGATITLAARAV
jgi:2-polyprenyl-3-methyl-5-hydroxy-6-metoxy-1,4-benzoquinol methylase